MEVYTNFNNVNCYRVQFFDKLLKSELLVFKGDDSCPVPIAWSYGLKDVGKALGKLNPEYDPF